MNQDEIEVGTKSANRNYVYEMVVLKDTEVTEQETKGGSTFSKGTACEYF